MESRKQRNGMRRQKFTINKRTYSRLKRLNWFLWVILLLCIVATCTALVYFQALQFSWLHIVVYVMGALFGVSTFVLMVLKRSKWTVFGCNAIGLLLFGTLLYRGYHVVSAYDKLQQAQSPMVKTMSVLVLKNSSIAAIQQVGNENIAAPTQQDTAQLKTLTDDIQTNMQLQMSLYPTDSYVSAYQLLTSNKIRGIAMNSAYASLLENIAPEYSATVKSVYDLKLPTVSHVLPNHQESSFNVLVSAVDSHLPIDHLGRSDVSLVVSVNTNDKKALITQTPVASFVKLSGTPTLEMDRIANDFIYGVDDALKTSEMLYDTSIDYYVRIHLEKLANMIDELGGITVDNKIEFTTAYGGYTFHVGRLDLDAQQALGYMRENVVVNGMPQQEYHQLAVLSAIFQKLVSLDGLMNVNRYMEQLQAVVQTNLPFKRLMTLMNVLMGQSQLDVQTLQVKMHPSVQSFVLPGIALPMGKVDQNSLLTIQQAIKDILKK